MKKYILAFLISMVPLIELRGGVPVAMTMGISGPVAIAVCAIGNMLPVPFIYLFARKVLVWGSTKPRARRPVKSWSPPPAVRVCSSPCCCSWASPCPAPEPGPAPWPRAC